MFPEHGAGDVGTHPPRERVMTRVAAIVLMGGVLGSPAVAAGQDAPPPPNSGGIFSRSIEAVRDGVLGVELSFLVPRGDFAPGHRVAIGYGVRGALGLGPRRIFSIGAAFRSVAHDSRTYRDTLEVKNMLRTLAVSGQIVAPLRYLRPYVGGSIGGAYMGTETLIEQCCDDEGDREWVLDDIRLAQFGPTASARVGLLVDVWQSAGRGQPTLSLDLGVEDHYGRSSTYQTGGDGPTVRTGTSHRVYSLGLSVRSR